jgi:DNA primase
VVARLPGLATMERLKRDRGARVYVDCGPQTVASAYSLRPGALVSAPVAWGELDAVAPEDFDIATMPERFARVGDLMP